MNVTNAESSRWISVTRRTKWTGKLQLVTVPSNTRWRPQSICMKPIVEKKKAAAKKATAVAESEDPGYGVDDEVAA